MSLTDVPRGTEDAKRPHEADLIAVLRVADDWNQVADTAAAGRRIRNRAEAAEQLLAANVSSQQAFAALEQRVLNRSLHKDWLYHGLDGAAAVRTLILLRAPNAIKTARLALWRDDAALEPLVDSRWRNPRAWTAYRRRRIRRLRRSRKGEPHAWTLPIPSRPTRPIVGRMGQ